MERDSEDNLAFHDDPLEVREDMLRAMKQIAEEVAQATHNEELITEVISLCMASPGISPSVDALLKLENAQPGSIDQALGLIKTYHTDRHQAIEEKPTQPHARFQRIGNGLLYLDRLAWTSLKRLTNRKPEQ